MSRILLLTYGCLLVLGVKGQIKKPVQSFEACWKLFDENYASFQEKKIDWDSVYKQYKPRVSDETTTKELFVILSEMLQPLGDAHVNLIAKDIDTAFSADRYSRISDEIRSLTGRKKPHLIKMMDQTLERNGFEQNRKLGPVFRKDTLFTYSKTDNIGYVRFFRSFLKLKNMVGPSLDKYLDEIFEYFNTVDALIIDVRFNVGGTDEFSQKVAGRFVSDKQVSFKKQIRKKKVFQKTKEKYILPSSGSPFLKPVVLLTNDQTFSAADVLALMMAQLPNVTIMGEPSNGSYSDLYGRKLPNGWTVTLSNQRYYDLEMNNFEGKGTPVDVEILNTLEDVNSKNDSVLLGAIGHLKKKI